MRAAFTSTRARKRSAAQAAADRVRFTRWLVTGLPQVIRGGSAKHTIQYCNPYPYSYTSIATCIALSLMQISCTCTCKGSCRSQPTYEVGRILYQSFFLTGVYARMTPSSSVGMLSG